MFIHLWGFRREGAYCVSVLRKITWGEIEIFWYFFIEIFHVGIETNIFFYWISLILNILQYARMFLDFKNKYICSGDGATEWKFGQNESSRRLKFGITGQVIRSTYSCAPYIKQIRPPPPPPAGSHHGEAQFWTEKKNGGLERLNHFALYLDQIRPTSRHSYPLYSTRRGPLQIIMLVTCLQGWKGQF